MRPQPLLLERLLLFTLIQILRKKNKACSGVTGGADVSA